MKAGIPVEGASDHGVSEAPHLSAPDDNGVELHCDRPHEAWPKDSIASTAMQTLPLDLRKLLGE